MNTILIRSAIIFTLGCITGVFISGNVKVGFIQISTIWIFVICVYFINKSKRSSDESKNNNGGY